MFFRMSEYLYFPLFIFNDNEEQFGAFVKGESGGFTRGGGNAAVLATKIISGAGGTPNIEALSNYNNILKAGSAARSVPLFQDYD